MAENVASLFSVSISFQVKIYSRWRFTPDEDLLQMKIYSGWSLYLEVFPEILEGFQELIRSLRLAFNRIRDKSSKERKYAKRLSSIIFFQAWQIAHAVQHAYSVLPIDTDKSINTILIIIDLVYQD